jgi:hypothetical protein
MEKVQQGKCWRVQSAGVKSWISPAGRMTGRSRWSVQIAEHGARCSMKGKCPKRGKLLITRSEDTKLMFGETARVRCPSCNGSWHQLSQLEWSE